MGAIYDMHVHLYDYSDEEVEAIIESARGLRLVAVSDDLESARRTVDLWERFPDRIIPCIGFHPWNVKEGKISEYREVLMLASRVGVGCIGEVGLDRRFVDEYTWRVQNEVFDSFIRLAEDLSAMVNVHSPNAWKHVAWRLFELEDARVLYHWYTGPVNLALAIGGDRVKFSINSAIRIQEKSVKIAKHLPLDLIVVESDGPYNYRGLKLSPLLVEETVEIVARVRGETLEEVRERISANSETILGRL